MVLADDDYLMLSHRRHVRRDPLRAVAHFDIQAALPYRTFLPAYSQGN
jgi:hypothetical protein